MTSPAQAGSGELPEGKCPVCYGSGVTWYEDEDRDEHSRECWECEGTGWTQDNAAAP